MRPVALHVDAPQLPAAAAEDVRRALAEAMDGLGLAPETELALVLTTDEALRDLNERYRGHDRPTDVLSFGQEGEDPPPGEPPCLGDIVISVERAAVNAAKADWSLAEELKLLAVHGLLHLAGHEDDSEAGAAAMRQLETELGARPPEEAAS